MIKIYIFCEVILVAVWRTEFRDPNWKGTGKEAFTSLTAIPVRSYEGWHEAVEVKMTRKVKWA